jgi:hypothetical protein
MLIQKWHKKCALGALICYSVVAASPIYSSIKPDIKEELTLIDIPLTEAPQLAKKTDIHTVTTEDLQANYDFLFTTLRFINYHVQKIFLHNLMPNSYITYGSWRKLITDLIMFAKKLGATTSSIDQEQSQKNLETLQSEGVKLVEQINGLLLATQQAVESLIQYRDALQDDVVSQRIRATLTNISQETVKELEQACTNIIQGDQVRIFAVTMQFENLQDKWIAYTFQKPNISDSDKQARENFSQSFEEIRSITTKLAACLRTQFFKVLNEDALAPAEFQHFAETFIYKIVPSTSPKNIIQRTTKSIAKALRIAPEVSTEDLRDQLIELLFTVRIARQLPYNELFFIPYRAEASRFLYEIVTRVIAQSPPQDLKNDLFVLNLLIDEIFETPREAMPETETPINLANNFCAAFNLFLKARTNIHEWLNNLGTTAISQAQALTDRYLTYKKLVRKAQQEADARLKKKSVVIPQEPEAWRTGAQPLEKVAYRSGKLWQMFDIPGFFHFNSVMAAIKEKLKTPRPIEPSWDYRKIKETTDTFGKSCTDMAAAYPLIWDPWFTDLLRCTDYLMLNLVQLFEWTPGSRKISMFEQQCQSLGILAVTERYQNRFYEFNNHFPYINTTIARMYGKAVALQAHALILCDVIHNLSGHVGKDKLLQKLLQSFVASKAYELDLAADEFKLIAQQLILIPGKSSILEPALSMIAQVTPNIQKLARALGSTPIMAVVDKKAPQPDPQAAPRMFDIDGATSAHKAAMAGKSEELLKNPALLAIHDNNGVTPLHLLIWKNDITTLRNIVNIIPPEAWLARDLQGKTPLHWALLPHKKGDNPNFAIVELITKDQNGKKSIATQDDFGQTPLHYAIFSDQEEIADAEQRPGERQAHGTRLVSTLLQTSEGQDSLLFGDQFDRTPLHLAAIRAASTNPREEELGITIIEQILTTASGKIARNKTDFRGSKPVDSYRSEKERSQLESLKQHGYNYPTQQKTHTRREEVRKLLDPATESQSYGKPTQSTLGPHDELFE